MRLLKLSANQDTFQTVEFNPTGLSIIRGRMENRDLIDNKNTYNGVGKSLIIRLIHFCLGANAIEEFKNKLPDWEFSLFFEIKGEQYLARRATNDQKTIFLNDEPLKLTDFNAFLEPLVFEMPEKRISYLTFRSLVSRFIRPYIDSYVDYSKAVTKEDVYGRELCNAYLLGLDPFLAERKHEIKRDLDNIKTFNKNIKTDSVLKEFLHQNKDVSIEIFDVENKINRLDTQIKKFIIAENFEDLKKEADELTKEWHTISNRKIILANVLKNIDKSLQIQPDITSVQLIKFFEEAQVQLGSMVKKEIEEVEIFNQKLIQDRTKRLETERRKFLFELRGLESHLPKIGRIRDEMLQKLDSTGALDDYKKMTDELSNLKAKLDRLNAFKQLVRDHALKLSELKVRLNTEDIDTVNYIDRQKKLIEQNISIFNDFAQRFYGENKTAGIEITNNKGDNQIRYHIKATIQDSMSGGINHALLYCFDFTLLKGQHNHHVNCLFHDSRLLAEMDPRQQAAIFRIAYEETLKTGQQYIISVNENQLEGIKDKFNENEYFEIIEKNIVLDLTDKSAETKLLGIQVDLNYE
jgi:uncharacterized protein YydD (DUF2326 family)